MRVATLEILVDESIVGLGHIIVEGDLDATGGVALLADVRRLLPAAALIVLDLRPLTGCDTAGVHAVLDAGSLAEAVGTRLAVIPAPAPVHRLFERSGANRLLDIFG